MSKDELGRSLEAEAEDLQLEADLGHIASSWLKTNKQTNRITNKTAYRWEKIFANYISEKGFVCIRCK